MNRNSNKTPLADHQAALDSALWTFQGYLRREGLRFTEQRAAVLQEALSVEGHFDAEQLHDAFRGRRADVSLATVYRTLGLLRDAGLVKQVLQDDERAHYEAVYGHAHHDHLICIECGRVTEFVDERIEELQRSVCRRHGFQALDHRMGIRGICRQCREAKARGWQGSHD